MVNLSDDDERERVRVTIKVPLPKAGADMSVTRRTCHEMTVYFSQHEGFGHGMYQNGCNTHSFILVCNGMGVTYVSSYWFVTGWS